MGQKSGPVWNPTEIFRGRKPILRSRMEPQPRFGLKRRVTPHRGRLT